MFSQDPDRSRRNRHPSREPILGRPEGPFPDGPLHEDLAIDQVDVSADDLKLGSLQHNGGPTETHALLPGSVARDVIPEIDCDINPPTDQRGEP